MLLVMAKVQIIGTKQCQDKTVQLLHRLGTVQIDAWGEDRMRSQRRLALSDEVIHRRERLAFLATRLEAVQAGLPALELPAAREYEDSATQPPDELLRAVEAELAHIEPQIQALTTRRDQLEEQLGSLARYEVALLRVLPLVPALPDLEHYAVSAVWTERRYQPALELLIQQLEDLTAGRCEVIADDTEQDVMASLLVFPKSHIERVNELLGRENLAQLRLPTEFSGQPFETALTNIRQRLRTIPQQLDEIAAHLLALAHTWLPRLLA